VFDGKRRGPAWHKSAEEILDRLAAWPAPKAVSLATVAYPSLTAVAGRATRKQE